MTKQQKARKAAWAQLRAAKNYTKALRTQALRVAEHALMTQRECRKYDEMINEMLERVKKR